MKNILLLGSNGFVGSYLYARLLDSGYHIVTASRTGDISIDLSDFSHYSESFKDYSFDIIICAAVTYTEFLPNSLSNVAITANILEYFGDRVTQIIFISSLSALEENRYLSIYNFTKYLSEQVIKYYIGKVNVCVLRFSQIIDINGKSECSQKGFHYLADGIRNNIPINVFSLNDSPRSYISVDKVSDVLEYTIDKKIKGFHDIVYKPLLTLVELVKLFTDRTNYSNYINFLPREALHYYIPESSKEFEELVNSYEMTDYLLQFIKK